MFKQILSFNDSVNSAPNSKSFKCGGQKKVCWNFFKSYELKTILSIRKCKKMPIYLELQTVTKVLPKLHIKIYSAETRVFF